jgi:aspartyl-tRNA(Asn)/glutamyl-tRNA(Gln) amidotransferase subunit A
LNFDELDFSSSQILLQHNTITCRQLTEHYQKKINEGAHLNAFISVLTKRALAKADEIDQKIQPSLAGKLAGLIVAIKGNINVKGEKTTCGSKILSNFISPYAEPNA